MSDFLKWLLELLLRQKSPKPTPTPTPQPVPGPSGPPPIPGPIPPAPVPPPAPGIPPEIQQLLDSYNAQRAKKGVRPLKMSALLNNAAQKHAAWMANTGVMSHTGANGSQPWDRMREAGYNYTFAGENIAAGFKTVDSVMNGWINSPGHYANMVSVNFKEVGFGVAINKTGTRYWCANLGAPSNGLMLTIRLESAWTLSGPLLGAEC